jgi:hypothetical protein
VTRPMHLVCRLGLLGSITVVVLPGSLRSLQAQSSCDALVARAFNEFDTARRIELLVATLKPTACPPAPQSAWASGVQLLAQTLMEDGHDSLAAVWLRWAIRTAPALTPDTVQFLPRVVSAYRTAREFVTATSSGSDSSATTTWLWAAQATSEPTGRLQVALATVTVPVRLDVRGIGPFSAGASVSMSPGSYEITASAPGYDSVRVTREVVPGVTTLLEFRLRSVLARLAPKPQPTPPSSPPVPVAAQQRQGHFPTVWVVGGAAVVGVVAALVLRKPPAPPPPPPATTGVLIVPLP